MGYQIVVLLSLLAATCVTVHNFIWLALPGTMCIVFALGALLTSYLIHVSSTQKSAVIRQTFCAHCYIIRFYSIPTFYKTAHNQSFCKNKQLPSPKIRRGYNVTNNNNNKDSLLVIHIGTNTITNSITCHHKFHIKCKMPSLNTTTVVLVGSTT